MKSAIASGVTTDDVQVQRNKLARWVASAEGHIADQIREDIRDDFRAASDGAKPSLAVALEKIVTPRMPLGAGCVAGMTQVYEVRAQNDACFCAALTTRLQCNIMLFHTGEEGTAPYATIYRYGGRDATDSLGRPLHFMAINEQQGHLQGIVHAEPGVIERKIETTAAALPAAVAGPSDESEWYAVGRGGRVMRAAAAPAPTAAEDDRASHRCSTARRRDTVCARDGPSPVSRPSARQVRIRGTGHHFEGSPAECN